jgi:hypothetical protein
MIHRRIDLCTNTVIPEIPLGRSFQQWQQSLGTRMGSQKAEGGRAEVVITQFFRLLLYQSNKVLGL